MSDSPFAADGVHEVVLELDGRKISLQTGKVARQAEAAVLVREGRTVVLVTVVRAENQRSSGFLPLTVEYREKLAAAGRIPGSFPRREGRISDDEILASRILDRSLRPLFPKGFEDEVQVQATVLSADPVHAEAPIFALLGACAAMLLSSLPWEGPAAGLRLVRLDGQWRALPRVDQRERAEVDLVVSGGRDGLIMVEGGAREVADEVLVAGLRSAHKRIRACLEPMERLRELAGRPKRAAPAGGEGTDEVDAWLEGHGRGALESALAIPGKHARAEALAQARERLQEEAAAEEGAEASEFALRVRERAGKLSQRIVRERVLGEGRRLDGRGLEDVRPIACEVDWLPSPHGSALFTRGETQAMVSCTLASEGMEQRVETLRGMEQRRFLLHYNFPPYSVGETRPLRGPGRREIGHGSLARRALEAVLPEPGEFPYVVRVESDISESNGSSSMATVCGGSLAMMDAGVPLRAPVAGIAMGLISDGERTAVLSDILGDEDHLGDMDFKVAGTAQGITALQMDNKLGALSEEVLTGALAQARRGLDHILERMAAACSEARAEPKAHAPRVTRLRISPGSLPDLIGPRGANIRDIESQCDVQLQIDQARGLVHVFAAQGAQAAEAVRRVNEAAGVVEEGRLYRGTVVSVKDFGAFVQIYRSAEGLVHVSDWDPQGVDEMSSVAQEGDEVVVLVKGVDGKGRLMLSRKEAQEARGEDLANA